MWWLAFATAASLLFPYIAREVEKRKLKKRLLQELQNPIVQQAVQVAKQRIRATSPGIDIPFIGTNKDFAVYDVPGAQIIYRKKLEREVKKELIRRGFSEKKAAEIARAVRRLETAAGIGEMLGTLGVSGTSAYLASKISAGLIARSAAKKAAERSLISRVIPIEARVAAGSAVGGVYEGATQTVLSSIAREEKLPSKREVALGALAGGIVSAGAGAALTFLYRKAPKPIAKKADWIGQSLIDPYEKPGDILGERVAPRLARRFRAKAISPSISTTPTLTPAHSPTPSPNFAPGVSPTNSPNLTPSPEPTPDETKPRKKGGDTPSTSDSSSSSSTSSTTPTPTPTPTPSPSPTPSTTPTPIPKLPPPLLPGPVREKPKFFRKGPLIYYDELALMMKLLEESLFL